MSKLFIALIIGLLTTGCAEVQPVVIGIEVASKTVVDAYCKAPKGIREKNRSFVAGVVAPNKIEITCVGDQ